MGQGDRTGRAFSRLPEFVDFFPRRRDFAASTVMSGRLWPTLFRTARLAIPPVDPTHPLARRHRRRPGDSAAVDSGPAAEVRRSDERTKVIEALRGSAEPMSPHDIGALLDIPADNVRKLLVKMMRTGEVVEAKYGQYRLLSAMAPRPTDPSRPGAVENG